MVATQITESTWRGTSNRAAAAALQAPPVPWNRLEASGFESHRAPVVSKRRARRESAGGTGGRNVLLGLSLIGSADGVPVEMAGSAELRLGAGREGRDLGAQLSLDVRIRRTTLLFDPAFVALSVLDLLAFAALCSHAAADADPESHVHVRSRTDLYDENGRDAGGWRVVAALARTDAAIRIDGQLLHCRQHVEPGERVVAVDAPWGVTAQPIEPQGVLLAGAWDARTGRGNSYRSVTTTLLDAVTWAWRDATAARIELVDIEVRRAASATGEMVSMRGGFTTRNLS